MSRRPGVRGGKPSNVPIPPIRFDDDEDGLPGASYGRRGSKLGNLIKRRRRPSRSRQRGFVGWLLGVLLRLATYYTVFSAIFTCGSGFFRFDFSPNDSRAVCRSLAQAKAHIVPLASPILRDVQQKLDPHVGPYVRAAAPYVEKAYTIGKPHFDRAHKHGKIVYQKHVEPAQARAIKRGKAYADPHIKKARSQYKRQVQPHIDTLHKTVKPYRDIYHRDVAPYVSQAQEQGLNAAIASHSFYFQHVHPRVVSLLRRLLSFWRHHLSPALRRAFRLSVQPLINKASLRLFGWEWKPIESDFVYEPSPVEEVTSAAKGNVESFTEAVKAKVVPSSLTAVVEQASSSIASAVGHTPSPDVEELDSQLDEELDHITHELENWERGLSKLIADEVKHYEGLIRRGFEGDDLATERQASISSVRKYLRQARTAFNKLMDDAKFDRSVDDFEGWDKGLGVRVKIFAQDLEQLERDVVESVKSAAAKATDAAAEARDSISESASAASEAVSQTVEGVREQASAKVVSAVEETASPVGFSLVEKVSEAAAAATDKVKDAATHAAGVVTDAVETGTGVVEDVLEEPEDVIQVGGSTADAAVLDQSSTPTEPEAAEEPRASILPIDVEEEETPASVPRASPQPVEADVREPTFSILPTEPVNEALLKSDVDDSDQIEQEGAEEPTFSILPIEVVDDRGTPAKAEEGKAAEAEEPTFSILPIENVGDHGEVLQKPADAKAHTARHEEL